MPARWRGTLGVALTARSKGENPVPMAGVPYHAVETYLHRMVAAGFKVAICEQMENPKEAKGVIKREVTRLVTPGTLTEDAMLDGREENFLAAVVTDGGGGGGGRRQEAGIRVGGDRVVRAFHGKVSYIQRDAGGVRG